MKEKATVKAIYIGRRLWGEKIAQVFLCGKKERAFSGIKWVTIGRTYLIFESQCPKAPEMVANEEASSEDVEKWEVSESIALQEDKRRRFSKKLQSDPRYLSDFDKLQRVCQKLNGMERALFVEFLVDKLSRERLASHLKGITFT